METTEIKSAQVQPNVIAEFVPVENINARLHVNPSNRVCEKNSNHIARLANNMRENGFSKHHPILVDKNGMILSGHHRYFAALEAKVGVYVSVEDGDPEAFARVTKQDQIAKKWQATDFIELYAKQNNQEYILLRSFLAKYTKIKSKLAIAICLGKANHIPQKIYDDLERGRFVCSVGWAKAEMLATQIMQIYDSMEDNWKVGTVPLALGIAILHMMKHPEYNHNLLLTKIQKNKFVPTGRREWNIERLSEIYNKGLRKNAIRFIED